MGLKDFLESSVRMFKLIDKPGPRELWQSIKITFIGLGILGTLGFIIKFLATMFQAAAPTS